MRPGSENGSSVAPTGTSYGAFAGMSIDVPISTMASGSFIVPVVGTVDRLPVLRPADAEVDRIMWVPLGELTRADTFREEVWHRDGEPVPIFFFELEDETIWGATARILHQLLRVALGIEGPEPPAL